MSTNKNSFPITKTNVHFYRVSDCFLDRMHFSQKQTSTFMEQTFVFLYRIHYPKNEHPRLWSGHPFLDSVHCP